MVESRLTPRPAAPRRAAARSRSSTCRCSSIGLYAFNENVTQTWPIENYSTQAGSRSRSRTRPSARRCSLSVLAALGATAIALVLGTLASLAVARYRFFGREVITFAVILPDRAAGDRHRLALQATILDVLGPLGVSFGLATIIIGHATFCVVVVYNNVIARMRRTAGSLDEASADLGADNWQTFRYVMFPQMRTALLAGGLLAFALSFDEVVVTIFTSGAAADAPDLDLRDARPARRAADRERRRALRDRRLDHPRLLRAAAGGRQRADGATRRRRSGGRRRRGDRRRP